MSHFPLPYRIAPSGTTAVAGAEAQIRDMIEQVLFTRRGERINRPDFGAGLHEMLFSESTPEIAAAAQHMVQAAVQQWLADLIDLRSVVAEAQGSLLRVELRYALLADMQERQVVVEGRI